MYTSPNGGMGHIIRIWKTGLGWCVATVYASDQMTTAPAVAVKAGPFVKIGRTVFGTKESHTGTIGWRSPPPPIFFSIAELFKLAKSYLLGR